MKLLSLGWALSFPWAAKVSPQSGQRGWFLLNSEYTALAGSNLSELPSYPCILKNWCNAQFLGVPSLCWWNVQQQTTRCFSEMNSKQREKNSNLILWRSSHSAQGKQHLDHTFKVHHRMVCLNCLLCPFNRWTSKRFKIPSRNETPPWNVMAFITILIQFSARHKIELQIFKYII